MQPHNNNSASSETLGITTDLSIIKYLDILDLLLLCTISNNFDHTFFYYFRLRVWKIIKYALLSWRKFLRIAGLRKRWMQGRRRMHRYIPKELCRWYRLSWMFVKRRPCQTMLNTKAAFIRNFQSVGRLIEAPCVFNIKILQFAANAARVLYF